MFSQRAPDTHTGESKSASISQQSFDSKSAAKTNSKFKLSSILGTRLKWNGSWLWEIGASLISIICLALLVAFLVKINGTPYTSWQYTVSPNTVISVITTITKASLLVSVSACLSQLKWNQYRGPAAKPLYGMQAIDQASRGPWGSLEVFFALLSGMRLDVLTIVGAFITILALAVDPFAQQILAFPERTVQALNETATIRGTHSYNHTNLDEFQSQMALPLISSMLVGLAQDTNPLASKCTSSTCDFPGFITMGVCSHCEDLSAKTKQVCGPVPPWISGTSHLLWEEAHSNCNYTLPDGTVLRSQNSGGSDASNNETANFVSSFVTVMPDEGGPPENEPLIHLYSIIDNRINYWVQANKTVPPPKPAISECSMWLCEQEFSPSHYIATDTSTRFPKASRSQELVVVNTNSSVPVTFSPPNGTDFLSKTPYIMDPNTVFSLRSTLSSVFNVSTTTASHDFGLDFTPVLQGRGIDSTIESFATSITNALRSASNPLSDGISGKAFRDESFIHVRWPWIILPISTTIGSIALLIGTLIMCHSQKVALWKDSVIPLMMGQLQTLPEHEVSHLRDVKKVNCLSKDINIYMAPGGGPLMFIEKPGPAGQ